MEQGGVVMARVLIIDDDPQIRALLRMKLEDDGYEVEEAADGKKGIDFYRQRPAELIITDIVMPTKEGIEMIAELREEYPDVTIIAISGGGLGLAEDYLDWAQHLGAQLTFAKPVDLDELSEAVHNLIDKEKINTRCQAKQR
ncbi:MAG: response regulator [bacterium]